MANVEPEREHPQKTIRRLRMQLAAAERRRDFEPDRLTAERQERLMDTFLRLAEGVEKLVVEVSGLRRDNALLRSMMADKSFSAASGFERDIEAVASDDAEIKGDLRYGAVAIAEHLGLPLGVVRNRIERKQIPTFKIGGIVCARRSGLDAWLAKLEIVANGGEG